MTQTLGYVALVVREYDEAIAFFTEKLGFRLVEDSGATDRLGQDKRWVLVAPPGSSGTSLLLARASTPEDMSGARDSPHRAPGPSGFGRSRRPRCAARRSSGRQCA